jgi:hypothetical protein
MAEAVDFARADAGAYVGRDVVEYFRGQAAGDAHLFDVLRGFDADCHEKWGLEKGSSIVECRSDVQSRREFVLGRQLVGRESASRAPLIAVRSLSIRRDAASPFPPCKNDMNAN